MTKQELERIAKLQDEIEELEMGIEEVQNEINELELELAPLLYKQELEQKQIEFLENHCKLIEVQND